VRVALLTEIPAPYRIPLFNALAERVELRVLFLADVDPRRPFYEPHAGERRFDHRILRGRQLRRGGRWLVLSRGVLRELRRFRPDAVAVGGWNQPAFWLALLHCCPRRIPLLVWIESTERDARSESRVLAFARSLMIRGAAGAFVPGRASAAYARSLGVESIETAPNAIDSAVFERAAVDRSGRDGCTFLYAGRLDREKGVDVLLQAFRDVPGELVIVGSGSEEDRLRALAGERVLMEPPRDRDALVELYAAADVFVLPSRSEPWGMVLNEAAVAGLPLIATEESGAAHDLIEDGVNGFLVRAGDVDALRDRLRRLAEDPLLRETAGRRSRELAGELTPAAWADGVTRLAHSVRRDTRPAAREDPSD
jgi:glycosyltransferase involved in cell wall biosynthesis